jgi:predicted CopG family antitoxin
MFKVLSMKTLNISEENRKKLLQLKLDWNMKSVDAVITELLKRSLEK